MDCNDVWVPFNKWVTDRFFFHVWIAPWKNLFSKECIPVNIYSHHSGKIGKKHYLNDRKYNTFFSFSDNL